MSEGTNRPMRLWLTSAKGGVGVSFAAANLALSLSRRGKRVLLIDGSPMCRCLDTVFSCAPDVVYDISDVAAHRIEAEKALLCPVADGPLLLPGAFSGKDAVVGAALVALLDEISATLALDFVIVDAPATADTLAAAPAFDRVLVLTDPSPAALRAAETVSVSLSEVGAPSGALLINRFSLRHPRESGQEKAILMVDESKLSLLGILPIVGELSETAHRYVGKYPLLAGKAFRLEPATVAFDNLAARLLGEDVPLLSGIRAVRSYRRKLLY